MERHHRRVYRVCLSYLRTPDDALDATQETFVKAFLHARRWDSTHDVGRWLVRIAINQSIDQYRKFKRRHRAEEPLPELDQDVRIAGGAPSPERRAIGGEIGRRIEAALQGLPEKQKAIFVLRHYEGQSLEEIARSLDLHLGTVKSGLHRALHHLRRRLHELRP